VSGCDYSDCDKDSCCEAEFENDGELAASEHTSRDLHQGQTPRDLHQGQTPRDLHQGQTPRDLHQGTSVIRCSPYNQDGLLGGGSSTEADLLKVSLTRDVLQQHLDDEQDESLSDKGICLQYTLH